MITIFYTVCHFRTNSYKTFEQYCVRVNRCAIVDAYAIGCGVLATIEQWYPTRKFNGTMVPHKRNSKVWPGLVTKEKTMKYPTSAMCTVSVYVCDCTRLSIVRFLSTMSSSVMYFVANTVKNPPIIL